MANEVRAWLGFPLRGAAGCQVSGGITPGGMRYDSSRGLSSERGTRKGGTTKGPQTSCGVRGEDDVSRAKGEDRVWNGAVAGVAPRL